MEDLLKLPQKLQKLARRPMPRAAEIPRVAAALRAFSIAELLGQILLSVDSETLLQAQQVNRQFQRIVLTTPSLRHKLWLEPPEIANEGDAVVINPIVLAHFEKLGIVDIEISTYSNAVLPIVRTTFEHRSGLAVLQPGSWRDMILADLLNVEGFHAMSIWHRTIPKQRHSERIAGLVTNVPHVRLGDCVDALLSMQIGAESFGFEDCFAALRMRRHRD